MADNIKIGVDVDDGGSTKKLVKDASELRMSYEGAAKAASSIKASAAAPTSTAGSRRAADMSEAEYNRLRGSAGATGASARDFANQAQGLGGLVRLYATYAANIFAVSAAFNALSNAMDTTNMIRGLDQLGAKSGTALGTLSKRLVDVTDGAISVREAMSSVAKASAAGMNSDNILRMGKVAKQASQALGVDMSDAVNRLTRGITKLEPELLDELGIFTKVDKATTDYAKSVGKTAENLTDFEKRMAFANAVLAEGEKKFKGIDMEANPYTKLLATVKDLAQAGLELVNKFLSPVVKLLAESPNALSAIMTALVALIVKQAIPALGEMRSSIVAGTQASAKAAQAKLNITKKLLEDEKRAQISAADAASEAASQKFEESTKKLAELSAKRLAGMSKVGMSISQKSLVDITDADLKKLDDLGAKNTKVAATYRQIAADIRAYQEAEKQGSAEREALRKKYEDGTITLRNLQKIANRETLAAYSQQLTAQAALRGSTIGFTRAVSDLFTSLGKARQGIATKEIEAVDANGRKYLKTVEETIPKMGMLQAGYVGLKGTVAAAAGSIGTAIGAMSGILNVIGVVTAALAMLDSIFESTSKQIGEFTKATERLASANDMLSKTIEAAYADTPYSVESLAAQGKAMMEVSDSFELMAKSATKAKDAISKGNVWDKLKDATFDFFGGGVQKNFEKSLAETIKTSVENLQDAPIASKLQENLSSILKVDDLTNFKQLEKALRGLDPASETVKKVQKALKDAGVEASISASKSTELVQALEASKKSFLDLSNQYKISDPLSRFAGDSIAALIKLDTQLKGPILESIGGLAKVMEDIDKNPIFGPEVSRQVAQYKDEIIAVNAEINKTAKAAFDARERLKSLQARGSTQVISENTPAIPGAGGETARVITVEYKTTDEFKQEEARLKKLIEDAQAAGSEAQLKATQLSAVVRDQINAGLLSSINTVAAGINAALAKGSTQVLQALYSKIDNIPEFAKKQEELKLRELAAQESAVNATKANVEATKLLTVAIARDTAQRNMTKLAEESKANPGLLDKYAEASAEYESANKAYKAMEGVFKNPSKGLKQLNEDLKTGDETLKTWARQIVEAAQVSAGFAVQLADINRQRQLIKLVETPLEEESKRAKQQKERFDLVAKSLEIDKEKIDTALQEKKISQEAAIYQKEAIDRQAIVNQSAQELDDIQSRYIQRLIVANGMQKQGDTAGADRVRAEAESTKNAATKLVFDRESLKFRDLDLRTLNQVLVVEKQRFDKRMQLRDLEIDIDKQRKATALEVRDLEIQLLEAQGNTSERQLIAIKAEQNLRKERISSSNKIRDIENIRTKELFAAEQELTRLIREGDAEQVDNQKKQIELIRQKYDDQVAQETQLTDLRASNIQKLADLEATKQLREGLAGAIETALFEGGKAGRKKLRDVIVAELKKPITLTIQASVNALFSGGLNSVFGIGGGAGGGGNAVGTLGSLANIGSGLKSAYSALSGGYTSGLGSVGTGISNVGSYLGSASTTAFGEGFTLAAGYGSETAMLSGLSELGVGLEGAAASGASLGGTLAAAGPYIAAAIAVYMIAKSMMGGETRGGSTYAYSRTAAPYMFGEMPYSSDLARPGSTRSISGPSGGPIGGAEGERRTMALFSSTVTSINSFFQDLGSPARIDEFWGKLETSSAGRGGVLVGGRLTTGQTFGEVPTSGQSNYAGNLFEAYSSMAPDAEQALKDFTLDLQQSMLQALQAVSETLPKQIADLLSGTDIELLNQEEVTALMQSISKMQELIGVAKLLEIPLDNLSKSMIDAAGGTEKLLGSLNNYYQNFYSEEERRAKATEMLGIEFQKLGVAMPKTREEFRTLVESLLDVAENGTGPVAQGAEELYAKLIGLSGAFAAVTDAAVSATVATVDTTALRIQILRLEGKTTQALNEERTKQLETLSQEEKVLQAQIWQLEDATKIRGLEVELLQAQGFAYTALIASRNQELMSLTSEEKAVKLLIYAQEDLNKTRDLQIRLLQATGASEAVLALQRERELAQYSEADQQILRLIYAYEDANTASTKLKNSLNETTSSLVAQIKQLKDYKKALLGGDKSTLTTLEKYNNAKQEVDRLTGIILSSSSTDKDRANAISSLTSASDSFLGLSRQLYSSSEIYTRDFNYISGILDSTSTGLEDQLTESQRQVAALESSVTFLQSIDSATTTTSEAITNYLSKLDNFLNTAAITNSDIVSSIAPAIASAIASYTSITGTTPATPSGVFGSTTSPTYSSVGVDTATTSTFTPTTSGTTGGSTTSNTSLYDSIVMGLYGSIGRTGSQIAQEGYNYWLNQLTNTNDIAGVQAAFKQSVRSFIQSNPDDPLTQAIKQYWSSNSIPAFATGADYLSRDMIAQVHQGERIISAPDNAEITRAFTNTDETNRELLNEIKKLNQKVDSLERTVAEGAVINVEATDRNTQQISRSVEQAGQTAVHTEAIRRRTTVV